jgi:hypothetical protein
VDCRLSKTILPGGNAGIMLGCPKLYPAQTVEQSSDVKNAG